MERTARKIRDVYKIEQNIGRGAFAHVKRAKHRETGKRYAVKVYQIKKMTESDRESIQTEIEILKFIEHPNIIKLYDVFEDEKYVCLVIELMEGGELFDLINEQKRFSEDQAREIVKNLIDSIQYCHQLGIVHRDIKPENLLFQSKERCISTLKLSDFGLSKILDENKLASTVCGTPGYVAPEILKDGKYGYQCDFWSIGVLTYFLITGIQPFQQDDRNVTFQKILSCEYNFEDPIWKAISLEAKDFIKQLIVLNPNERLNLEQMQEHPWILNQQ